MQTKWISVKIVVADENNCGKESCPHFSIRSAMGAYYTSCKLYNTPLGRNDRGPVGVDGTVPRCEWCLRAKEV